jgi:uncharacterized membrane protein
MKTKKVLETIGWVFVFLFAISGIIISVLQIPPNPNSYNEGFEQHPVQTLMHVIPGLLFMLLGPIQFMETIRKKYINFHRWCGRIFLVSCLFIVASAFYIVVTFPFEGLIEQLATLFFGGLFTYSLIMAYHHIRKKNISKHREFVIRVFSIGLGIITIRILIGVVQAMSNYQFREIFGWTFWGGFGFTWLIGEWWIWYSRSKKVLKKEVVVSN